MFCFSLQVRRDCAGQLERVRLELRKTEVSAAEAQSHAQAALASRASLQGQVRTLQSQLCEAQGQVEAGKVQLQQLMAQLQRVMASNTPTKAR